MSRCLRTVLLLATLAFVASALHPAARMQAQQTVVLDINTASLQQLQALPGMGAAYAERVIAGRPYTAKNQLVTRGVLPATAYDRIKDRIVAHRIKPVPPGF